MASALQEQEKAVGITAFVSPDAPAFGCTIKHRYTDFLVNEILPDGTVLHLVNDRVVKKKPQDQGKEEQRGPETESNGSGTHGVKAEGVDENTTEKSAEKRKRDEHHDELGEGGSSPSKRPRVNGEDTVTPQADVKTGPTETSEAASNTDRKAQIISGIPEQDKSTIQDIFGEKATNQILNLYASVLLHPGRKPRDQPTVLSEVIPDKSKRTEAHGAVRQIFASKLVTETMQNMPGQMSIRAAPTKGPSGARAQAGNNNDGAINKGKLGWEELGGEYLHFTLYKENKDTMEVLYFMATQLKVPAKNFQFAGTKDRRGVTTQRVAIYRLHADRLQGLNRMLRGSRLGDFEYKKHGLDLGESNGNEFLLTLRDVHVAGEEGLAHGQRVELAKEIVSQAADSFGAHGFLNYYGLQRFGTFSTGTHATGQKMLKGDLEGAVDSILAYSDDLLPENVDTSETARVPQDDINRAHAIRTWRDTGTSGDIVARMPRRFQAESAIIQYLSRKDRQSGKRLQEKDWQGALMQIQRNLRLMYVHAYQSFVWNTVVSRRWELHRGKVVEGDLVIVGEKDVEEPVKQEVDDDGEVVFHPAADDSAPTAEDSFTRARHLSKEEAESGKYNIFDIVLPLPGYDVSYPANEVGKFYEEFMASEVGGGLDPHNMRRAWKDVSLSGGYRKMLARTGEGFGYEIKGYVSDEEQMVETDLEKLNKRASVNGYSAAGASNGMKVEEQEDGEATADAGDRKIAVVVKMQLGSSQYATMALRELTKGGAVNYKPDYSSR